MVDVIIPVYKPNYEFYELLNMLLLQTVLPNKIILMVTSVEGADVIDIKKNILNYIEDNKVSSERLVSIEFHAIDKHEFDHGGTRHKAVKYSNAEIVLFMTQDAYPADRYLIEEIIGSFNDENVAAVYARQIAKEEADAVEIYTRIFNYPEISSMKSKKDIDKLGVKTYFCSNVCAAYRRGIYDEIGGFKRRIIFNEDMIYASEIIKRDYTIYYNAKALVYHSHNYSWIQQFKRNFDLGVSQKDYCQIFNEVSSEKEGTALVKLIIEFLFDRKKYLLAVEFIIECVFRYAGYLLGKHYKMLPKRLILMCSMNKEYWNRISL